MNEEQKNIETCLAENILSEVANVPTDPQFRSLTDEALDPLKQQAASQAGYDGYKEVVMYHQPYTFTSQVKQMKSNLILLLRRLWRFPFGMGTTASSAAGSIRSFADMWQHYITRLKGNSEYGIPSRLSQLTDLPSAPALLSDRKISGVPEAADGMSVAHLLCGSYAEVTEIKDDTHGWTYSRNSLGQFPNAKKVTLGCKTATVNIVKNNSVIEELNIPELETVPITNNSNLFNALTALKFFYAPKLKAISSGQSSNLSGLTKCEWIDMPEMTSMWNGYGSITMSNCPVLKWINIPKFDTAQNITAQAYMCNNPELERVVMGKLVLFGIRDYRNDAIFYNCPKLVHLEIGQNTAVSLLLSGWNPTYALQNQLSLFLSNFKQFIADRLTDNGSGKTLTLSQEVRNAIHAAEDEYGIENIIITQKGWTISPAPN